MKVFGKSTRRWLASTALRHPDSRSLLPHRPMRTAGSRPARHDHPRTERTRRDPGDRAAQWNHPGRCRSPLHGGRGEAQEVNANEHHRRLQPWAPLLTLNSNPTNPIPDVPFIRGFGTKTAPRAEPPVALQRRTGNLLRDPDGSQIPLNDVEASRFCAAPQGTLRQETLLGRPFHRPSPGHDLAARVEALWQLQDFQPLRPRRTCRWFADHLFATFSYFRERSDGYVHDIVTGNTLAGSVSTISRPGPACLETGGAQLVPFRKLRARPGEDSSVRKYQAASRRW